MKPRAGARRPLPQKTAGREFETLVAIMARLRGPGGCPWDQEQTLESLRGFVLEETYEVLDAIDRGDRQALRGEIGDMVFEGVFLAQIAADEGHFTIGDSLRHISEKLIRRHPHIFGTTGSRVRTSSQVLEQWEQIKAREQKDAGERRSLLRGVPKSLPSLLRAHEIGTRVATVGFDWAKTTDVMDKIEEEVSELRHALTEGSARTEEEMGDLLFTIANLARKLGIEPESALRKANEKFTARFEKLEHAFEARGRSIHDATLDEMEAEWRTVKSSEVDDAKLTTPTVTVELHAPTASAKNRRSEEAKATGLTRRTRAGRAPAGGRRRK